MRLTTLAILRCIECGEGFQPVAPYVRSLDNGDGESHRIRDGAIVCRRCGAWYPVESGLLDLRPARIQSAARRSRVAAACALESGSPQSNVADPHKARQEQFFTEEAEGYERDVVGSSFYQALDDLTVHRWGASLPPGSRVLEIGAGTGRVALRLAERGHHVIALDLTEALLRKAQRKVEDAHVEIDAVISDAESLPVNDGTLDAVAVHGVLHHLTDPARVISEAGRALRAGGRWFSLDPHRSPLRGVFDAAMRLIPLWKEEAAPDGLQTEERLLSWCGAAGISASASYSCYVLPHLLTMLPRSVTRGILRLTDALFARSVMRKLAGVIHVWGAKGDDLPARASSSWRASAFRVMALLLVLLATRAWRIDPDVTLNSTAYYMGGLEQTLEIANAPARWGAVMVFPNGDPIEVGTLDDIGYAVGLQLISKTTGALSGQRLARIHQLIYAAAAFLFAWAIGARFQSTGAGVAVLLALAVLGSRLAMLIYGQVSNQTITSVFPLLFLAALIPWSRRLAAVNTARGVWVSSLLVGVLAGGMDLIRHSHGLAILLTVATVIAFGVSGVRRRAQVTAAFVVGFVLVTVALPAGLKVHRDITLGRYDGFRVAYLRKPPQHHVYYTLLTAIGRYPNSLGLMYEDRSVDEYITSRSEVRPRSTAEIVERARPLWLQYIRDHPGEYVRTLASGAIELPAFVAYTTFMAERRWTFGWPAVVPGLEVEPRDIGRYGENLLMNVRYRYLRLSWWQWLVLALAVIAIVLCGLMVFHGMGRSADRLLIGSSLAYLMWVALPRALVPVQGMDLIFGFWTVVLSCGVFLFRVYPPEARSGR